MHIKKVRAKRFLSFGEDGMEIDFTKFGRIINIQGENHDYGPGFSNGSGKSSCIEAIVYGLYGKLMKGLNHKAAGNIYSRKGLEVEVEVDNLRIVRRRNPESLELFENGVPIAVGGIPATQDEIVRRLRLNYSGFCNVSMFGQGTPRNFLQSTPEEKRKIAENLLCLEDYARFQEVAKTNKKDLIESVKVLGVRHEMISVNQRAASSKVISLRAQQGTWVRSRKTEIESIEVRISQIDAQLSKMSADQDPKSSAIKLAEIDSDIFAKESKLATYRQGMDRLIKQIEKNIAGFHEGLQNVLSLEVKEKELLNSPTIYQLEMREKTLVMPSEEMVSLTRIRDDLAKKKKDLETKIECLHSRTGKVCDYCNGQVSEENLAPLISKMNEDRVESDKQEEIILLKFDLARNNHAENLAQVRKQLLDMKTDQSASLAKIRDLLEKSRANNKEMKEKVDLDQSKKSQGQAAIARIQSDILDLNVERKKYLPREDAAEIAGLKAERQTRVERLAKAKMELREDPFRLLVLSAESEVEEFAKEIQNISHETKNKERLIPYYDYWVRGFGDKGVRSFLLEERLPLLNSRMDYWLRVLIDNRLGIEFDRDLNETIRRKPDDSKRFVYESLSGGELNRIDLAISQAFAYVTMASSQACPSLIALDEIALNFDRPGVLAIYKMICELSKDRQVLVITHDPELLETLRGCDTITAQMRNGITRLDIKYNNR